MSDRWLSRRAAQQRLYSHLLVKTLMIVAAGAMWDGVVLASRWLWADVSGARTPTIWPSASGHLDVSAGVLGVGVILAGVFANHAGSTNVFDRAVAVTATELSAIVIGALAVAAVLSALGSHGDGRAAALVFGALPLFFGAYAALTALPRTRGEISDAEAVAADAAGRLGSADPSIRATRRGVTHFLVIVAVCTLVPFGVALAASATSARKEHVGELLLDGLATAGVESTLLLFLSVVLASWCLASAHRCRIMQVILLAVPATTAALIVYGALRVSLDHGHASTVVTALAFVLAMLAPPYAFAIRWLGQLRHHNHGAVTGLVHRAARRVNTFSELRKAAVRSDRLTVIDA